MPGPRSGHLFRRTVQVQAPKCNGDLLTRQWRCTQTGDRYAARRVLMRGVRSRGDRYAARRVLMRGVLSRGDRYAARRVLMRGVLSRGDRYAARRVLMRGVLS